MELGLASHSDTQNSRSSFKTTISGGQASSPTLRQQSLIGGEQLSGIWHLVRSLHPKRPSIACFITSSILNVRGTDRLRTIESWLRTGGGWLGRAIRKAFVASPAISKSSGSDFTMPPRVIRQF